MPDPAALHTTPLYDWHVRHKARMVPFAGYQMPLQYAGIMEEHRHTRTKASLFDVSHMGQVILSGDGVAAFLESLTPGDMLALKPGQMRYSVLLNDRGGIVDDIMVTRREDDFLVVLNAGRKAVDVAALKQSLPAGITMEEQREHALIAVQGPLAERALPQVAGLRFMTGMWAEIVGIKCYITRSGYTGEDGFEISVPGGQAETITDSLLTTMDALSPAGLGARDTLRLEAGLCLYGHDLDEDTTPVEAALSFVIGKRRREQGGFPGASVILKQLLEGVARQRLAFLPEGRAPVREGAEIVTADGVKVGVVTSGTFSPTLDRPVAMGYVAAGAVGKPLLAMVRGKAIPLVPASLPFVPTRYKRQS